MTPSFHKTRLSLSLTRPGAPGLVGETEGGDSGGGLKGDIGRKAFSSLGRALLGGRLGLVPLPPGLGLLPPV